MSTLTKMALAALAGLLVGGGAAVAGGRQRRGRRLADDDRDDHRPRERPPGDVSGPCDEAEHANDPRCGRHAAA